jgi:hypothetical protein
LKKVALASTSGLTELFIKASGKITSKMVSEFIPTLMTAAITGTISKTGLMVKEPMCGLMETTILENGKMA